MNKSYAVWWRILYAKKQTDVLKPVEGIEKLQVCSRFNNLFGSGNFTG